MDELIERLENATGPDRGLDEAIYFAVFGELMHLEHWTREQLDYLTPYFTASIDAAWQLVPEGFDWLAGVGGGNGQATVWRASLLHTSSDERGPALNLCIAALKARRRHD